MSWTTLLTGLAHDLTMIVFISFVFSFIQNRTSNRHPLLRQILTGLFLGLLGAPVLLNHISIWEIFTFPEVRVNTVAASLFGGPFAAGITILINLLFATISGDNLTGILEMVIAAIPGSLYFLHHKGNLNKFGIWQSAVIGLVSGLIYVLGDAVLLNEDQSTWYYATFGLAFSNFLVIAGLLYWQRLDRLFENEARLSILFNNASEGIWMLDPEGRIVTMNDRLAEILGVNAAEQIGEPARRFICDEDRSAFDQSLKQNTKGKQNLYERRYLRADGSTVSMLASVAPSYDNKGTYTGSVAMFTDLQKVKMLETELTEYRNNLEKLVAQRTAELEESQQKYASLFSNQHTVMLVIEPQSGVIIDANPAAEKFYGYTREQLLAMNIAQINTMPVQDVKAEMELAKSTDKHFFNFLHKLANGETVPVEVYSGPVIMNGQTYLLSIVHDISTLKKIEVALAKSEENYRTLFERSIEGISQTTPEGKFLSANNSMAVMLGYDSPQDLMNTVEDIGVDIFINPAQRQQVLEQVQANGFISDFEIHAKKKDGTFAWISLNSTAVIDEDGIIRRLDNQITDISSRKQAEFLKDAATTELDNFFSLSPDLMAIFNLENGSKRINQSWMTMLGFSQERINELETGSIFHPLDRLKAIEMISAVSKSEVDSFEGTVRLRHSNGGYRSIEWLAHRRGNVWYLVGRDITEKIKQDIALKDSQTMLRSILDNIPQRVFWKDINSVYLGCNQRYADDCGLATPDEIIGKTDFDMPSNQFAELYVADDQQVIKSNTPKLGYEERETHLDGTIGWVRTNKLPLRNYLGEAIGILASFEDITEDKKNKEALRDANQQLGTWVVELEKRNREADLIRQMDDSLQLCHDLNEAFPVLGLYLPQLLADTSGILYLPDPSSDQLVNQYSWGAFTDSKDSFLPEECWSLRKGRNVDWSIASPTFRCKHIWPTFKGDYLDIPLYGENDLLCLIHLQRADGNFYQEGTLELIRMVVDNLQLSLANLNLRDTLHQQSMRDPLTGLYNRRFLDESLNREIHQAKRNKRTIGVILLDVDHFKSYNDEFGHEAGDLILKSLADTFQSNIRKGDIPCRVGGEEFLLLMPETTEQATIERAETLRQLAAESKVIYKGQELKSITISLGVSFYPRHANKPEELIQKADAALYKAKRNGRNRTEVADD